MNRPPTRPSLGRRVLCMFLTWLLLGAVIGAIAGLGQGGGIPIICMMIGGMAVLPIAGVVLALIGGDAKGSVAGAAGGLLGCGIAGCFGEVTIQPQAMNGIVIFCALVGATAFLFGRFLLWKYRMMFRTLCWAIGVTPASGNSWIFAGHTLVPNGLAGYSAHSAPVRALSRRHRLLGRLLS
jgi:hypothetical protein